MNIDRRFARMMILLVLLALAIAWLLSRDGTARPYDWISVYSAYLTALAFAFTISQVLELRRQAKEIKSKVDDAKAHIEEAFTMTDIAMLRRYAQEVIQYTRYKQMDCALIRLQDARDLMVRFSTNAEMLTPNERKELVEGLASVNTEINKLQMLSSKTQAKAYDPAKLHQSLEALYGSFAAVEARLQFDRRPAT